MWNVLLKFLVTYRLPTFLIYLIIYVFGMGYITKKYSIEISLPVLNSIQCFSYIVKSKLINYIILLFFLSVASLILRLKYYIRFYLTLIYMELILIIIYIILKCYQITKLTCWYHYICFVTSMIKTSIKLTENVRSNYTISVTYTNNLLI